MELTLRAKSAVLEGLSAWNAAREITDAVARDGLGLREAIRCEASALGVCLRRALIDRVCATLGPLLPPDTTPTTNTDSEPMGLRRRVAAAVTDLEELGELTAGDLGLVAPAPLRAVWSEHGTNAVVMWIGAAPTTALARALGDVVVLPGTPRRSTCAASARGAVETAVHSLGGRVVSLDVWAGLDRSPERLDVWGEQLLARYASRAPTVENAIDWSDLRAYDPDAERRTQRARWRRGTPSAPTLVRARQPGGWWETGWGAPNAWGAMDVIKLNWEETLRTAYWLDARAGCSLSCTATLSGDVVRVSFGGRLPRPEHRWMMGLSRALEDAEGTVNYVLSRDVGSSGVERVASRLGLTVVHAGGL